MKYLSGRSFLFFYLVANLLEESCSSKRGEITITSTDLESSLANVRFRCNLFTWWCLPQGQLGLVDKTWQQSRNGMALRYNHMHFLNTLLEKIYNINVTQHMISATKVITRSQHANTTHIACPISYTLVCCICSHALCMFACSCFTVQRQTLYCL